MYYSRRIDLISFIPVVQYIVGLGVFGFTYWLLDGILGSFISAGVHETGATYDILLYAWAGGLFIYILFGGWWLVRKYNEAEYRQGF